MQNWIPRIRNLLNSCAFSIKSNRFLLFRISGDTAQDLCWDISGRESGSLLFALGSRYASAQRCSKVYRTEFTVMANETRTGHRGTAGDL